MLLRASEHKQMVWKNGGGITSEIARAPINDQEEFDWRLSLAQVKPPGGPFSLFPGIDRTLCVVSQNDLYLTFTDNIDKIVHLTQDALPYSFPGELSISCRMHGETLTDLNVMTRRGKFRHEVERMKMKIEQAEAITIPYGSEEIVFIVIGQGQVTKSDGIEMAQGDALRIDQHSSNQKITAVTNDTQCYIIRLNPILS